MSGRFVGLLIAILVLLSVARVVLANWLVESSGILRDLDNQINEQSQVNQKLAESVREKSSLANLENQAKTSGFVTGAKLTFVRTSGNMTAAR